MPVRANFDQHVFRQVMSHVATPVAVVTTINNGRPHGTTVSAFMSLSLKPPTIVVALDRKSELLTAVQHADGFAVNVLDVDQVDEAMAFAGTGGAAKFDGIEWRYDRGLPRLVNAPTWLACEKAALLDGGDHVMVVGGVFAAESDNAAPLIYHTRTFGTAIKLDAMAR